MKPFIKWAGGKGRLSSTILDNFPNDFNTYIEPFIGGGAMLYKVLEYYDIPNIIINDINKDLINTYTCVRDDVDILISMLRCLDTEYNSLSLEDRELFFNNRRNDFNNITNYDIPNITKAMLFIFLNKTCFNGLYRVNRKGKFNVPIGSYANPKILDEVNLRECSNALKDVTIYNMSYKELLKELDIDENTFIYLDPPYRPITKGGFNSYHKSKFNDKEQIELSKEIDKVNENGGKFLLSNSDPKMLNDKDNFFDDLYKNYNIKRIEAPRTISSKGNTRNSVKELIISNY